MSKIGDSTDAGTGSYCRMIRIRTSLKAKFILLRYPGRRQVRSWSQTWSELEFGLSLAAS